MALACSLVFFAVLAAETDGTRQAITSLIVGLVLVAALLAGLTVWYWFYTSPKRRARSLFEEMNRTALSAPIEAELIDPAEFASTAAAGPVAHDEAAPVTGVVDVAGRPASRRSDTVVGPGRGAHPVTEREAVVVAMPRFRNAGPEQIAAFQAATTVELDPTYVADELAAVRRRRRAIRQEMLSDDQWAAAVSSAFDEYRG